MEVELVARTHGLTGIQQSNRPPHTSDRHPSKHNLLEQIKQKHGPPARLMQLDGMSPHGQLLSVGHHRNVGGAGLNGLNGNSTVQTRKRISGNGTKTATMSSSCVSLSWSLHKIAGKHMGGDMVCQEYPPLHVPAYVDACRLPCMHQQGQLSLYRANAERQLM